MKTKLICYWIFTALTAFELALGAAWDLARTPHVVSVVTELGYPLYILIIVGVWKALAVVAMLVPGFPRLKEWAYAGVFFEMTGAAASHAMRSSGLGTLIAPLVFAAFAMVSWALLPPGRKLGAIVPLQPGI